MRKQVFGRKLKRDANERKALLKGLMTDLVLKESIKTTEEKAKAIKGHVEKLITKAKNKGVEAEPLLQPYLSVAAYRKVLTDLAKRFEKRAGGYTRIIKLGQRFGDNAHMVIIEWVDDGSATAASAKQVLSGVLVPSREKTSAVVAPKEKEKKPEEKITQKAKVVKKTAKPVRPAQDKKKETK